MYPLVSVIRRNLGAPGVETAHHGALPFAHIYCRLSLHNTPNSPFRSHSLKLELTLATLKQNLPSTQPNTGWIFLLSTLSFYIHTSIAISCIHTYINAIWA